MKYKLPDRIQKHTRPPRGDVRKNDKGRTGARRHGRELKEPEKVYPRARPLTEIRPPPEGKLPLFVEEDRSGGSFPTRRTFLDLAPPK